MDAAGVKTWLSRQSPGPKTDIMRAELETEGAK